MIKSLLSFKKDQPTAVELIQRALNSNHIVHAYLFSGFKSKSKIDLIKTFSQILLCSNNSACSKCRDCKLFISQNHPDIRIWGVEEKSKDIKIDQIKELIKACSFPPVQSKRQIFIIEDADKMNITASNALLKTLEEPFSHTVVILEASILDNILPTIQSRCQIIPVSSIYETKEISSELKDIKLPPESLIDTISLSSKLSKYQTEELIDYFQMLQIEHWNSLKEKIKEDSSFKIDKNDWKYLEMLQQAIEQLNMRINSKLVIENLLLEIL